MARILDALRQHDSHREGAIPHAAPAARTAAAPAAPRPYQPDISDSAELVVQDDELSYIEVGAADHSIEGSPDVLASAAAKKPGTASLRPGSRKLSEKNTAGRFAQVAFCPLPAETLPRRPAYDRFAPEIVVFHHPENPICEQYRAILAGIEAQLPEGSSKVMMLTGSEPHVGTTTVLLNLAITCTRRSGLRVAVVDANFNQPALAERLGLIAHPGLREILLGTVAPQRALQETGENNLLALCAGDVDVDSAGLLNDSATLRGVIHSLRGQFDVVLVDSPSWTGRPEIVALGSLCDAVYVVASSENGAEADLSHLRHGGAPLRGTISTRR